MPNTTTKAAFARICKVTKPGIAKAIKLGLVVLDGKKVNLDHRLTHEYYFKRTGKKLKPVDHVKEKAVKKPVAVKKKKVAKKKPACKKPATKKTSVEPITAPVELSDNDPEPDILADDGYKLPDGIERFEDITIHNLHKVPKDLIDKIKSFEVAAKAKQSREVSRGKLIERDIVKKVFAKIHTVDTNQWKTLEDKITPDLCSLFKAQDGGEQSIKARKMINLEVTKILKYTKRLIDEFFIENKEAV